MWFLKRMIRTVWTDRVSNEKVLLREHTQINTKITTLGILGHVLS